jgi:hypothetical protein
VCEGKRPIERCSRSSSSRSSSSLPVAVVATSRSRDVPVTSATPASRGIDQLHHGIVAALAAIKVIPSSQAPRSPEIVLLGKGSSHSELAEFPHWSSVISVDGTALYFPLRPEAEWRRNIAGQHSAVVNKKTVTLIFKIHLDISKPEKPVFSVRDFDAGPFSATFRSTNWGELELKWLSQAQGSSNVLALTQMKGKKFMGLNSLGLAEYLCSLTPGYEGFRAGLKTRGAGEKGDVGPRQQRRIQANLSQSFEELLQRTCPDDLAKAFDFLRGAQSFKELYKGSSEALELNNPAVQSLVDVYKRAKDAKDKMEATFALSIFSTKYNSAVTITLFGCTKHEIKRANLLSRMRRITVIVKADESFGRFEKETVEHMESCALRDDNVLKAAFSDRQCMRYFLGSNINRIYHKYVVETACLGVTNPMGKTSFYRFYRERIFKQKKKKDCACSQCVDEGDVGFDLVLDLVKDVFPVASEKRQKYLNDLANMQLFYERQYRGFLVQSSKEVLQCLTYGLSRPNQPEFRCECKHQHVRTLDILERYKDLFSCLRADILTMDGGTHRDDFIWILDGAEDHLRK